MKVIKDEDGALIAEGCPIYRIRKISDYYKGLLLVSVNGVERRVTREQWSLLEELMRSW